jgi:hypothetical protein
MKKSSKLTILSLAPKTSYTNKHLQDFSKATRPVSFFVFVHVRFVRENVHWQDILDNGQTTERLVVKTRASRYSRNEKQVMISRYPMVANKQWIEANEQEIMGLRLRKQSRQIRFELN